MARREITPEEARALAAIVGEGHLLAAADDLAPYVKDWTRDLVAVPAAVGELDDALTLTARVDARLGGGWEADARGWWTQADNHESAGLGFGLRLAF